MTMNHTCLFCRKIDCAKTRIIRKHWTYRYVLYTCMYVQLLCNSHQPQIKCSNRMRTCLSLAIHSRFQCMLIMCHGLWNTVLVAFIVTVCVKLWKSHKRHTFHTNIHFFENSTVLYNTCLQVKSI